MPDPGGEPPLTPRDYFLAIVPILGATVALWFQLWKWPTTWQGNLPKVVTVAVVFIVPSACEIGLLQWTTRARGRVVRRAKLCSLLDQLLEHDLVDPTGKLDARANVMVPHNCPKAWWDGRAPGLLWGLWPTRKLYIVAASRNMIGAPEAGLPWARDNGCAGRLWQSGDDKLFADLRSGMPSADDYGLTETQRLLTEDIPCIV